MDKSPNIVMNKDSNPNSKKSLNEDRQRATISQLMENFPTVCQGRIQYLCSVNSKTLVLLRLQL